MGIRDIMDKFRHKKEVFTELDAQDKAMTKVNERKLSSNERALNKIIAKKREEQIKVQLDKHYKHEDKEYWHKDIISQKNIFKEKNKPLASKNLFTGRMK